MSDTKLFPYTVLSPVKSGGKRHGVNAPLSLTKDDAAELESLGIIRPGEPDNEPAVEQPVEDGADAGGPGGVEIINLIAAAFADLADGDFTSTDPKRPKVKSVERILKGKVDPKAITP